MIGNVANSVLTTSTDTRVDAFVANASSVEGAVIVDHAFRLAEFVGVSQVIRETGARAVAAFCVRATGRGVARVCWDVYHCKVTIIV